MANAEQAMRMNCNNSHYYQPTHEQLNQSESLFQNILSDKCHRDLKNSFDSLGLILSYSNDLSSSFLLETPENCQGRGSFAVNYKATNKVMLQSPHSFYDKFTGNIAEQIFSTGLIYAASWNSSSRKENTMNNIGTADLSRSSDSYMMRFSFALAKKEDSGIIVQLHGFSQKKRKTNAGRIADVIISNGTKQSSNASRKLHQCLKKKFVEHHVFLYPYDVYELGATGNSIAKGLRRIGFNGFVHMEMSYPFRKKIMNNPLELEKVSNCLSEL